MFDKDGFLKLKAQDKNDLKVFAAYLQDSLISSKDIKYLAKNKTLICIFSRFMWEDAEKGLFRDNRRIRSALKFNSVTDVKSKNINIKQVDKVLEFLTIDIKNNEKDTIINLIFSGEGTIMIKSEAIDSTLEDFSDSWVTKYKPRHKI